ncbi:hypothetical protein [Streptomyces sp. SLBN-31]|uniref:hypothetical protein n=1 Tax=Streptomyces sp. SLBN-31 TaxID=2768444 RepID=UPI00114DB05D|nr:hypothetical protein [Streptomyces sp. SLBN-31]
MSTTGFMPGAARTHLLARPDWAMPDTLPGGLTIFNSSPAADGKLLAVGSTPLTANATSGSSHWPPVTHRAWCATWTGLPQRRAPGIVRGP